MKKKKINWRGVLALLVWSSSIILLIHDFILLMQGYMYTWYGVCTLGAMLFAGCMAEDYMNERIRSK